MTPENAAKGQLGEPLAGPAEPGQAPERAKRCKGDCKRDLPLSAFGKNRSRADGLAVECRECTRGNQQRRASLTQDVRDKMLASQDGVCAACRHPFSEGENPVIDHCHTTKKIRGLVHKNCNAGLGQFNDSPVALVKAATYLMKVQLIDLEKVHPEFRKQIAAQRNKMVEALLLAREVQNKWMKEVANAAS